MAKSKKKIEDKLKLVESVSNYKMLPVDVETYDGLIFLIGEYGFPKRSQGVMVKKLVNEKIEELKAEKQLKAVLNTGAVKAEPVVSE